jgi:hypothetical protein
MAVDYLLEIPLPDEECYRTIFLNNKKLKMGSTIASANPEIYIADINSLDFTMIKRKLQEKEEGQGWTKPQCDEAETEYRRFLALKRNYPDKEIVPHKAVDIFWHQHILDTERYSLDCNFLFGQFLHHYPYFGMNGKKDAKNLTEAFNETKMLYKYHFGEDYVGLKRRCMAPKCRTQCKPMKCK